ncbi:hypothetical protein [Dyadobacter psychrotolerans]|uniref:C1q domain-containing protein n=1 Tax=Dyadobacter psychrotolerans TaxID=2541721 RepID=A0A4R5DLV7_9BACT|nr:hypothetical protein [Dyadobacter psychrotolerans]TDE14427.1 hypothetical protein E0F88_14595 [Dyadobacter psychrotolerans]
MKTKQVLSKVLAGTIFTAAMIFSSSLFAQVKIGTNPTTINAANNLEVEASTAGRKTSISKTTGQVTIADGTEGDGKLLTSDVNGAASWQPVGSQNSPVLFNVNSATQIISAGTTAYVDFSAKVYDKGNNLDLTTNALTIPTNGTGVYQFNCIFGTLNQAIVQGVYIQLEVNGSTVYSFGIGNCASGAGIGGAGGTILALTAGDVVKVKLLPSLQPAQSITFFHFNFSGSMVSK